MKNEYKYKWILAAPFIIWAVYLLSGCYTDKAASKAVTKAILLKPAIAATLTRAAFPCITVKADTTINNFDTTIMADCPPLPQAVTDYFTVHDTAFFNNIIIRKVPVTVQLPAKTITIKVKDSADVYLANNRAIVAEAKSTELQHKLDKYRSLLYSLKRLLTFWQVWLVLVGLGAYWQRHKIIMLLTGIPSIKI